MTWAYPPLPLFFYNYMQVPAVDYIFRSSLKLKAKDAETVSFVPHFPDFASPSPV